MKEISELTGTPLVIHGGSRIPTHQIEKAIEYGHTKINVNTELQQVWTARTREVIATDQKVYDPRKIIGPGKEDITETTKSKMRSEERRVGKECRYRIALGNLKKKSKNTVNDEDQIRIDSR